MLMAETVQNFIKTNESKFNFTEIKSPTVVEDKTLRNCSFAGTSIGRMPGCKKAYISYMGIKRKG